MEQTQILTSKVTSLQGLLETGQWERKRIYVLKFSQRAESEDYNESVMGQRSKDLSLADGLKGGGNCFYESCSKTSKKEADESEALARSVFEYSQGKFI